MKLTIEKQLPIFKRGYSAGMIDGKLNERN